MSALTQDSIQRLSSNLDSLIATSDLQPQHYDLAGFKEILVARIILLKSLQETNLLLKAQKAHTGLTKLSIALEDHPNALPLQLQHNLSLVATSFLDDPDFNPHKYENQEALHQTLMMIRSVARAILWQISNQPEPEKSMSYEELVEQWTAEYGEEEMYETSLFLEQALQRNGSAT